MRVIAVGFGNEESDKQPVGFDGLQLRYKGEEFDLPDDVRPRMENGRPHTWWRPKSGWPESQGEKSADVKDAEVAKETKSNLKRS